MKKPHLKLHIVKNVDGHLYLYLRLKGYPLKNIYLLLVVTGNIWKN